MEELIFLGGTCNGSKWRDELEPMIKFDCYNPIVEHWGANEQAKELAIRKMASKLVYVITPKMMGTYSIAELVDDSNKRPHNTVFYILEEDDGLVFTDAAMRSLRQVGELVSRNNAMWVHGTLENLANFINHYRID